MLAGSVVLGLGALALPPGMESARAETKQALQVVEPKPEASPDAAKPAPERPAKGKPLDAELLESLGEAQPAEGDEDPLGGIVKQMRSAQQRINDRNVGAETRELQAGVVKDLEQLIKLLQQQKQQQKSSSQNSQQQQRSQKPEQQPNQRQGKPHQPQNSAAPMPGAEAAGERKADNEKSRDSTEKIGPNKPTPSEVARRQQLEKDVWGHLPPALRQELLNSYTEKFLPKYDELVRRYYEALAERNKRGP
jgi:hypothetical protein